MGKKTKRKVEEREPESCTSKEEDEADVEERESRSGGNGDHLDKVDMYDSNVGKHAQPEANDCEQDLGLTSGLDDNAERKDEQRHLNAEKQVETDDHGMKDQKKTHDADSNETENVDCEGKKHGKDCI